MTGGAADRAEHLAERPSWDCRTCGSPWPCVPARASLNVAMDRVALAIYMWVSLEEAVQHLSAEPVAALFERFIRWTR